ncbi:hypothetical protein DYI22_10730 [Marinobacter lipolyticus]|uniref:hypothetical protein n=1 Tax=Marinobacter lipolyticus TaxID=209639 RepID=UPI001BD013D4|nr:hypothetical protein [Marinobacter lipolyticus]MBS8240976.1 hypothetical protein [Marinobacter lipolyticus]
MDNEDDTFPAGTARPAQIRKAGCGIRYDDGELEGVDFSKAGDLRPGNPEAGHSANVSEDRKADGHPKPA